MDRAPLFKNDFKGDNKPKEFCFLIRSTLKQFNEFILLLDKMISENINRDFFQGEVSFENSKVRSDGKVDVRQKGTIQILNDWLGVKFRTQDTKPIKEMISSFKEIRKLRLRPAHAIDEDVFDQKYFRQQREIIIKAYAGVTLLRLIFLNHPRAKSYKIPEWLESGKIWTY